MRIAIGGFQHETNTFVPETTDWSAFQELGGWPPLTIGAEIIPVMKGRNLPAAGMIEEAKSQNVDFIPLIWCQAEPGGMVERDAYERIVELFLKAIDDAGPVDGVLLDLHGAMVVDGIGDGEGDFLKRIRAHVGPDVFIGASLDLHANVSQAMVDYSDFMSAYRTYPHVDMAETGRRTARVLFDMVRTRTSPGKSYFQVPYLIPIPSQCTLSEPTKSIYARLEALEVSEAAHLSYSTGFPPSDTADCGPTLLAYSFAGQAKSDAVLKALLDVVISSEAAYAEDVILDEEVGVALANQLSGKATRPIVLVDTQDNPGAGGTGDTTGLIKALIKADAQGAVVAVVYHPEIAALAHERGRGAIIEASVGGRSGPDSVTPINGSFEIVSLADGDFVGTGDFYAGSIVNFGKMALLRIAGTGVEIVVGSRRSQAGTQGIFRHLGLDPDVLKIIGLKSSVHFRADFQEMAERIIVVKSPGYNTADPAELPFKSLRNGVRLRPLSDL